MRVLEGLIGVLNRWMLGAAAVALCLTMGVAVANLFLRPLRMPIQGCFELVGLAGAVIAAFALGRAQERRNHIAVDILFERFPGWLKGVLDGIGSLSCAVFFGFAAYRLARLGLDQVRTGEVSETLRIVTYPFVLCVALGVASLALTLALDAVRAFGRVKGGA